MLINNMIGFSTTGIQAKHAGRAKGAYFKSFVSTTHKDMGTEHCTGDMVIGDTIVTIFFKDHEEIQAFCQKHNIELADKRGEA